MNVVKHIICELTGYRPGTVDVSQGDRGSRAVSCRLMENGAPWMIPEGATARVAYTLPDGTEGLYDRRPDGTPMWEIAGNIVTVELADQLMAQAGMVQMSILIIGPEGGQLATWPIRVMVSANKAARLTVPETMPPYGAGFEGRLFYGGPGGVVTPLELGPGLEIRDGVLEGAEGPGGGSGQNVELDSSLTQSGKAADAKATGDEIKRVEGKIPNIEGLAKTEDIPKVPNWAMQASKPDYNASEVGADPTGTAASAVGEHNTSGDAHTDIRVKLEELRQTLAHFFNATTPETMDQISEIVRGIETNADLITALTTGKVSVSSIVANLTTNLTDRPLAASMGVELKKLIDQVAASLVNYQPKGNYALESAVPTKVSQLTNDKGYLTEHQDISGKLDKSELPTAINTALAQAKANGEFDGAKGDPGQAATLEITGATALAYGAAPTVTEVAGSTAQARKYKLGIPAGKPGGNEDETPTVVLPRKLYAVAGHEYVLYYANILRAMRPEDFVVTATFADSSALLALKPLYSNMLRFTPTADHVGEHSITITVKSRRTWATVAAKTVTLIISADATRTDNRVMFIGDSLTYASVYAAEIQRMSGDGIMAVGTVSHAISFDGGSVRIESEGRNSAASYDYVSKQSFAGYSNPFYNPGVEYSLDLDKKYTSSLLTLDNSGSVSQLRHHFDFAYYMVNNGATVGELDAVFINLGTNGGNKSAYESVYIAFDAMIERIRAYSSDLPIFVHMFPPKSEAGSTDRGANGTFSGWVNERTWYYDIIQTFIDRYDNDPRVIVVPTYTMLDPVFDYKRETVAASARSTDTITIGQTDGTHPATSGYLHMADSYYNALQALWSGAADTRYYSVTYNLGANVSSSNTTTTVAEGASYSATLTAKDGYDLDTVSVTMGGSAVAVTGGSISISAVTGDIVITATAVETPSGPANLVDPSTANDVSPNLALDADEWVNGYTVSGSNDTMALTAASGRFVSDKFPISDSAKVRIQGMDMSSAKRASNKLLIIMSDGRIFRGMAMPIGEAGTTAVDQDLIASEGTMLVTISKFGQATNWPGKAYARIMGYAKNGDNSNVFVTVE